MQLPLMNVYLENASEEMIQTHMIYKILQNDCMPFCIVGVFLI